MLDVALIAQGVVEGHNVYVYDMDDASPDTYDVAFTKEQFVANETDVYFVASGKGDDVIKEIRVNGYVGDMGIYIEGGDGSVKKIKSTASGFGEMGFFVSDAPIKDFSLSDSFDVAGFNLNGVTLMDNADAPVRTFPADIDGDGETDDRTFLDIIAPADKAIKNLKFLGDVGGDVLVDGDVKNFSCNTLAGDVRLASELKSIKVGGTSQFVTVDVDGPLGKLDFANLGEGAIFAESAKDIRIRGDTAVGVNIFDGDLNKMTVNGTFTGSITVADSGTLGNLGTLKIDGDYLGNLDVEGDVKNFTSKRGLGDDSGPVYTVHVGRELKKLAVTLDIYATEIQADSIKSLSTKAGMYQSYAETFTGELKGLSVSDFMDGTVVHCQTIGKVKIGGNVHDSTIESMTTLKDVNIGGFINSAAGELVSVTAEDGSFKIKADNLSKRTVDAANPIFLTDDSQEVNIQIIV